MFNYNEKELTTKRQVGAHCPLQSVSTIIIKLTITITWHLRVRC